METPRSLQRSMATAEELHSVVRTMKSLSSTTIHQYERAVAAMGHYVHTVELGFRVLLRDAALPVESADQGGGREAPRSLGVIAFGTDRGFCGPFNREVAEVFTRWRLESSGAWSTDRLVCQGLRLEAELEMRDAPPDRTSRMPGSVAGIVGSVQELLVQLDTWQVEGVERVVLIHQRPTGGHEHEVALTQLIPLDREWLRSLTDRPWPTNQIPMSFLAPRELVAALTRELVFAALYRAHAESLASEHAARLEAMRLAEQTIEDRMEELEQRYHQVRQAMITEELLDVSSGFEAISSETR